jgi:hypothetical protein
MSGTHKPVKGILKKPKVPVQGDISDQQDHMFVFLMLTLPKHHVVIFRCGIGSR